MRALPLPQWRFDRPPAPVVVALLALGAAPLLAWLISEQYWRTLFLLCSVGLSPLALRWPVRLVFGAYVFLIPFTSVSVFADTGGATITKMVGVMAAVAFLAVGVVEGRLVRPPGAAIWFSLLVLWAILTLAWSVALEDSSARVQTALSLLALYLVAVSFRVSDQELRIVCLLAMIGGALAATAGVILGFDADASHAMRGRGTLAYGVNPNGVAQSLLLPLAAAIAVFVVSRSIWRKALTVAAIGAIGLGIFLTMSRGSLLATTIMMGVLLFRFRVRWQLLFVLGVLAAVLPLMPDLFFQRVTGPLTGDDATGAGRTEIWKVGFGLLQHAGWLGSGVDTFPTMYVLYGVPGHRYQGAHNTLLSTSIELGVVGLVLLLIAMFTHLRAARCPRGSMSEIAFPAVIEAACFGFLVTAMFGDDLWTKTLSLSWILAVWSSRISRVGSAREVTTLSQ